MSFVECLLDLWLEFLGGSPLCILESCFATLDLSTGESDLEVELPILVVNVQYVELFRLLARDALGLVYTSLLV